MNKLISLFLCCILTSPLYAVDPLSLIPIRFYEVATPPPPSELNTLRLVAYDGIGIKLRPDTRDVKNTRISWSLSTIQSQPIKKLAHNYFFIPADCFTLQQDVYGIKKQFIDIVLSGRQPGKIFNNLVAEKLNIGQKTLTIALRLIFENDGKITVKTYPIYNPPTYSFSEPEHRSSATPGSYSIAFKGELVTHTHTGEQVIQLYLKPYKTLYTIWRLYNEGIQPFELLTGEDTFDGVTTMDRYSAPPAAFLIENSLLNQGLQVPVFEHAQSPVGF